MKGRELLGVVGMVLAIALLVVYSQLIQRSPLIRVDAPPSLPVMPLSDGPSVALRSAVPCDILEGSPQC